MPDDLVELLHDGIDDEESLHDKARKVVEQQRAKLLDMMDSVDDIEEALAAFAVAVEDELTDITSEAVMLGKESYLRRAEVE